MTAVTWALEFKLYSVIHVFCNTIIHHLRTSEKNIVGNQNPYLTV